MNYKDKTVLVWDAAGLGIEHAARIAKDVKKCLYFTPWAGGFSHFKDSAYGRGFPNLERILHFFRHIKEADLIFFVDTGFGDALEYIKEKEPDKLLFGAGDGEDLENYRMKFRKLQEKIGLDTQDTVICDNLDDLREHLKENKNQVVKIDIFRGDLETLVAESYDAIEERLDEFAVALGPFKDSFEFMCEELLDGHEPGFDQFFSTRFIRPSLWGFEKKRCYVGRYDEVLPKPFEKVMDKMTPVLRKLDYRGAISIEGIMKSLDNFCVIDVTARFPYSVSIIYTESIVNYTELIFSIAEGNPVDLVPAGKYVVGMPVNSLHADEGWVRYMYEKERRDKGCVKFRECASIHGKVYGVKGTGAAFVIAVGDDLKKIVEQVKEEAKNIKAYDRTFGADKIIDEILEDIEKIRELEVEF